MSGADQGQGLPEASEDALGHGLSAGALGVARAFAEALLARGEMGSAVAPEPELLERVVSEYDDWVHHAGPRMQLGLTALLYLVDFLPLFVMGSFSRMKNLPVARRVGYLERVEHSRVGLLATAFMGLKVPVAMLAYEVTEGLALTGIDRASLITPRRLPVLAGGAR
jgi:hypothetical protein